MLDDVRLIVERFNLSEHEALGILEAYAGYSADSLTQEDIDQIIFNGEKR